jgi:signal transduction histidine kinase
VEGDPGLIRQLLAPVIDNAERHAASEVTVELAARQNTMLAIVRDDGPGVDPALGETIFLPGVRGPDEGGDGAGLGLPLAQRLAHSCGGEIQLGEGPGGCFVIVLPVAAGVTGEPNTPAPTLPGAR